MRAGAYEATGAHRGLVFCTGSAGGGGNKRQSHYPAQPRQHPWGWERATPSCRTVHAVTGGRGSEWGGAAMRGGER